MNVMSAHPQPQHLRHADELRARQAELQGQLRPPAQADAAATEVHDLKDLAEEESRQLVDDVALARLADELDQVAAALRRLDEGSFGSCVDCGEPIDERRLDVMPASACCASCQRLREVAAGHSH